MDGRGLGIAATSMARDCTVRLLPVLLEELMSECGACIIALHLESIPNYNIGNRPEPDGCR